MHLFRTGLRNPVPVETRRALFCRRSLLRIGSKFRYSTPSRAQAENKEPSMLKRAVNEHSAVSAKPLQSSASHTNGAVQPKQTPQPTGIKRKIEMTGGKESSLGNLHSAVYFDENDFDDDDDLDFEAPDPFAPPARTMSAQTPTANERTGQDSASAIELSPSPVKSTAEIKYPDLPPLPDEEVAPSSSAQLPWSSSPISHFQEPQRRQPVPPNPPSKRRMLPWLNKENERESKTYNRFPSTPVRSKSTLPWNKSASAIKEEQKELRRLVKKSQEGDSSSQQRQPRQKLASLFLSDEQRAVLEAVVDRGKSIFFTGSAGTGKSVLMREIIQKLRDKYRREPDRVAVTASTGLAACNVEGITLHSFAGIGLGKEDVPELVKKIKKNNKARTRWLRTKVLVIDEVSMVDGDLFDKLEEIARRIRNNGRPFGGIQLVITGDFFQLPPVPEGSNREAKFAFSAATWNTSIQHTVLLTHVFRQKDPVFADMLNEMRLGKISPSTVSNFKKLSRPLDFHDSLEATELFPTRNEVENANSARMSKLSGEMMTFHAVDSGTVQDPKYREKMLSNCMAPPVIHLKKGAQVMLIKNMEETLVNGSIGRVIAFMDEATFDIHRTDNDLAAGGGASDDEKGHAKKKLKGFANDDMGVKVTRRWPLVAFVQPDGTERHLLCQPESWKIELPNGEVQAQRQQVPLILAWALSIHKAQGQTLQRVKVNLGRVFERGQAYVALSRATSQAGLQVIGFEPHKVMVHPKVVEFYSKLVDIGQVMKSKNSNPSQRLGMGAAPPPKTYGEDFEDDFDDEELQYIYAS